MTRRTVLTGAVVGGAAIAASAAFAGSASAAEEVTATTQAALAKANIKHVVFLMMENRSFDHLFGSLSGVRGFDDRTVKRPDGGNIFAQYDAKTKSYELPYRLSESNNLPGGDADLSHNWGPQHMSLNGGANDNWINAHRAADGDEGIYTMGYLTRADAPYHYAMADAFTVCDNYFCSVLGPTYPNRLMWEMGSLDANAKGGGPLLTTDESVFTDNQGLGVFDYETFPERLTKAGITWQAFTEPASNHLLNMFPAFTQYNASATSNPTNVTSGTVGTNTGGFLALVEAGQLPQVSWIFPTAQSTEHPGDGPINAGPQYYEPIITALMSSPSWADTALFLTYDENDGYFDHVPPPSPPAGTPGEFLLGPAFGHGAASTDPTTGKTVYANDPSDGIEGPVGLGFRVPNLVISRWSTGGRVNSELFDHTSCLKLVETIFGVSPKGIVSDWRYSLVGDLTSCFDFTTATPAGAPPAALQSAFTASQALFTTNRSGDETPPKNGTMPTQETTPARKRVGPVPSFAAASTGTATTGTAAAPAAAPAAPAAPAKPGTTTTSATKAAPKAKAKAAAVKRASVPAAVSVPTGTLAYTGGLSEAALATGLVAAGVAAVAVNRSRSGNDASGAATAAPASGAAPGSPAPRPAIALADGIAGATGRVASRRIRTGGASDSTRAGGRLPRPAAAVEVPTADNDA